MFSKLLYEKRGETGLVHCSLLLQTPSDIFVSLRRNSSSHPSLVILISFLVCCLRYESPVLDTTRVHSTGFASAEAPPKSKLSKVQNSPSPSHPHGAGARRQRDSRAGAAQSRFIYYPEPEGKARQGEADAAARHKHQTFILQR